MTKKAVGDGVRFGGWRRPQKKKFFSPHVFSNKRQNVKLTKAKYPIYVIFTMSIYNYVNYLLCAFLTS